MTYKTIMLTTMTVPLLLAATWLVWNRDLTPVPEAPELRHQAEMQQQLSVLRGEMDGLKKEIGDLRKLLKVYKRQIVTAKGKVLNADQDIQRMVESALKEEPVRPIADNADLIKRARALGLTKVEVLR